MPEKKKPRRDEDDIPRNQKPFPIQRRHLGTVKSLQEDKSFGFIESENFRDDVFFHFSVFESKITKNGTDSFAKIEVDLWVEFELDEEIFRNQERLRAKVVRPTERPQGKKLSGRDATFKIVMHHPRARKKRPTWRDKES